MEEGLQLDGVPNPENRDIVFMWELEEITMLSEEKKADTMREDPILKPAIDLLDKYMKNILLSVGFIDEEEINKGYVDNIEEVVDNGTDIMMRMGPKYNALRQLYDESKDGKMDLNGMINYAVVNKCGMSEQLLDLCISVGQHQTRWSQSWLCLRDTPEKAKHVVISRQGIAHAATQLLVAGQHWAVPIENIYSVANCTNERILEKIQNRFGRQCRFVAITTMRPLGDAARKYDLPVWPINNNLQKIVQKINKLLWMKTE